jgi:hypothetical protein
MALSTEQQALFNKLASTQTRFNDLTQSEQDLASGALRPNQNGFTEEQRALIYPDWWLIVNDVASLQEKLPKNIGIAARSTIPVSFITGAGWSADANGEVLQVLSGSLLTDCREGETYGAIGTDLWRMVIARLPIELFPIPEDIM